MATDPHTFVEAITVITFSLSIWVSPAFEFEQPATANIVANAASRIVSVRNSLFIYSFSIPGFLRV